MTLLPLARLLAGDRPGQHPVALGDRTLTLDDFRAACAGAVAAVPTGSRVLLACDDAWSFAAGLVGLGLAGRTVMVPPNLLPGTLDLLAPEADAVLTGFQPAPPRPDAREGGQVEFWTSGSTGTPKRVLRSLVQVEAEAAVLEAAFGSLLGPGPVVGTVPHQHIYGCSFRIVWPLAAGRPFLVEPCGDPGRFLEAMRQPGATLVSSPAHLSRLPRLLDLERLGVHPQVVFSSGGPLAQEDALAWRPAPVVEVYGSTETGGIAWRRQDPDPDSALWRPFPDLSLACAGDGALVVAGARAGREPVRMGDVAELLPDGRIRLRGRLDRVVKLDEKRVSLPELEAALERHPWVKRAAVVLLPGPRPVLGAVLETRPGAPGLRAELVQALQGHLAQRFESAALPRRWRVVQDLPVDDRGKLTAQALAGLFGGTR